MRAPIRSMARLLVLTGTLVIVDAALPAAAWADDTNAASEVEAQAPKKPKRSLWDVLRFRNKAGAETPKEAANAPAPATPPVAAPAPPTAAAVPAPTPAPAKVTATKGSTPRGSKTAAPVSPAPTKETKESAVASAKTLGRTQSRVRAGAAAKDPSVRALLDKVDRNEARSSDLNALATALAKKGLREDALSYQNEAVRIDRKNPTLFLNLGTLQRDMGRKSAAMSSYRRALDLDPNNALAHYNIGTLLDADGEYDGAIEEYRMALTLDPTLADPVKNPQVVNNERLTVVNLLLYGQKAGALGLPLVPVKSSPPREGER